MRGRLSWACHLGGRCSNGVPRRPQPQPANISLLIPGRGQPNASPVPPLGGQPLHSFPGPPRSPAWAAEDTCSWEVRACAWGWGAASSQADLINSAPSLDQRQACPRVWPWPRLHPVPPVLPPPPPSSQTSRESRLGRSPPLTWSFHTEGRGPVRLGTRIKGDDKTCPSKLGQSPRSPADYSQRTPRTKAPSRSPEGH